MRSGLNVNGAGSEAMKMQRQDVVLAPARAFQMPAAAVIWRLRNVDVGMWAIAHLGCRGASCVCRI